MPWNSVLLRPQRYYFPVNRTLGITICPLSMHLWNRSKGQIKVHILDFDFCSLVTYICIIPKPINIENIWDMIPILLTERVRRLHNGHNLHRNCLGYRYHGYWTKLRVVVLGFWFIFWWDLTNNINDKTFQLFLNKWLHYYRVEWTMTWRAPVNSKSLSIKGNFIFSN